MARAAVDAERRRLAAAREGTPWKRWGPYLSERQWGTVREDYSTDGDAWRYFSHDHARSRAYRWGEDGIAGYSDDKQRLCFALTLWNGVDPILKERLFGLTNAEGNHGEDVKEIYYYLDATPTHSYLKALYKYPQRAYPYDDLVETNGARTRFEPEYELLDTGVFDDDRYFDVLVEYAKSGPDETLVRITAHNRGPGAATLHLLPTLWFRNTWSAAPAAPPFADAPAGERPRLAVAAGPKGALAVRANHPELGAWTLLCEGAPELLFTENETNTERVFGQPNASPFVKDAFHALLVGGRTEAVNPAGEGTKAAAWWRLEVPARGEAVVRLRLAPEAPARAPFGKSFEDVFRARISEADEFYARLFPPRATEDDARIQRQSLAGMIWTKQYFLFDVEQWLAEHGARTPAEARARRLRNADWFHMLNDDVISMPDKWEYPWYAAWDLAFHTMPLAMVDPDFAKEQLEVVLRGFYLHPNGQIPAYEWNFGDVNPPVHAAATWFVYHHEKAVTGKGDLAFLRSAFPKLLLNFTWWVNRKDQRGNNIFAGGFLGLDNIGVFDRSAPLPTGGSLEQADGTAWMAFYCLSMLRIAFELALDDPAYEDMALKFIEHFLWIASSMDRLGESADELWDEEHGFFYDVLVMPDGKATRLRVRSLVGLLPLCASAAFPRELLDRFPRLRERVLRFLGAHPELLHNIASPVEPGVAGRRLLSTMNADKLRRVLARMLDEQEFLSPYGIRSLSRAHLDHPYSFRVGEQEFRVAYEPAESTTGMFGGNSNWRGPIWMPMNFLIVNALLRLYTYYGDDFTVECPTGSGVRMTLYEVAHEISSRLLATFRRDAAGRRPVFGGAKKLQTDPHFRDHLLFYEYFHGDDGAGVGASHQTGWTGVVARLVDLFGWLGPEDVLKHGL